MTTASDRRSDTARQHRRCESETRDGEAARNLLLLAPDIQEELPPLEVPAGRQPVSEHALRWLMESLRWTDKRVMRRALRAGR